MSRFEDEQIPPALTPMRHHLATGASANLATCRICETLCHIHANDAKCPVCGTHLHLRSKTAFSKSVAYLIAAYILYIPANLLPVMHTETIFGPEDDTIMSGVVLLFASGSWPLGLLVFFASVMVPLLKLFSMSFLLFTCWRRSASHPLQRTQLFRIVETVGRWSMLDIYVVTVLVALVQFQSLAAVYPGEGAFAFATVVVLTMLSAINFDSRLIWDAIDTDE
ncbi:paraquat-inducible protein A [Undibacterium jejuense]|nr:paraquat-inducible protein A [Undibacterium jejuense]